MAHHVLHDARRSRPQVLLDLVAAPGRTVVFTRTKHRAKKLARQLNGQGVPAVELHGNLSQNARTRTMEAPSTRVQPAPRRHRHRGAGIHVDDVALVIHADPPVEHKAYTHRSGRTARAGASGTVVTLMTDDQVRDVRDLTRKAGVTATTTACTPRTRCSRSSPRRPLLRGRLRCSRGSGVAAPGQPAPPGSGSGQGLSPGLGSGSASWRPERRRVR